MDTKYPCDVSSWVLIIQVLVSVKNSLFHGSIIGGGQLCVKLKQHGSITGLLIVYKYIVLDRKPRFSVKNSKYEFRNTKQ